MRRHPRYRAFVGALTDQVLREVRVLERWNARQLRDMYRRDLANGGILEGAAPTAIIETTMGEFLDDDSRERDGPMRLEIRGRLEREHRGILERVAESFREARERGERR
jgi:hypothetical protein